MPGGDGTGPFGTFKNCMPAYAAGNQTYRQPYERRFFGRAGFGRGFSWRYLKTGTPGRAWFQQPQPQDLQQTESQAKDNEIEYLEKELETIKRRLEELRKGK